MTAFPVEAWRDELEGRRRSARRVVAEADCDIGLVFGTDRRGQAFRYLTNFEPLLGDMWLLLGDDASCFLTFQWQIIEARELSGIEHWHGQFDPVPLVVEALRESGAQRVGVVGLDRMPVPAYQALQSAIPRLDLVDLDTPYARLRRRKSAFEVALLREAAQLTDEMLDLARAEMRVGARESEIAATLAAIPLAAGGECSFEPTVISGVDDPVPIRRSTARMLKAGDSVMVDVGAAIHGYQGDATRTFVLGTPSSAQLGAWDVVRRAYDAALDLARPGVPCSDLHRAGSAIIEGAGFSVAHRIGHGIGLATSYEWPSLDTEEAPLEPGMTICIEPGVFAPGAGNMKLEDDLVITDDGFEILTRSDATLEVPLTRR
jgi:Xaa-Pro aminopeptidase